MYRMQLNKTKFYRNIEESKENGIINERIEREGENVIEKTLEDKKTISEMPKFYLQ